MTAGRELSVAPAMLAGMDHPWRRLRALAEWELHWRPLDGQLAVTDWTTRTITMDPRQLQAQRRSTLAHELEHVERGPAPLTWLAREEAQVEQAAARRLIPLDALAEALAWAHDEHEAAEELWVDVALLRTRLAHLHPAERAYLKRRLADGDR